jgi:hypothetical protein
LIAALVEVLLCDTLPGLCGSSAAVLAAPARKREPALAAGAPQVVGDLGVEGRDPEAQLLGLARLELDGVAPVPAPEQLGDGHVQPAPRALGRPEDVPGRAHLEHVISCQANLKRAEGASTP